MYFQWLSGLVALQTSIACHLTSKKRKLSAACEPVEMELSEIKSERPNVQSYEEKGFKMKSVESEPNNFKDDSSKLKSSSNLLVNGLSNNHDHDSSDSSEICKGSNTDCINGSLMSRSSYLLAKPQNGDSDSLMEMDVDLPECKESL